jgi:uncharacterized protein (TIGR03435 family)
MRTVLASGILVITYLPAFGQSAAPAKAFEVASIKSAPPPTDGRLMVRMGGDPGRLDYTNVSLKDVIRVAFKVRPDQISGPDWLTSERYIISAKYPAGATKDDVPAMLQALLADRFKLTYHKDSKVLAMYALVQGKGGPKLTPAETSGNMRMMMGPKGRHMTGKATMPQLADMLSNMSDRPVIDMTELKGSFEIDLEFTSDFSPEGMRMGMQGPPPGGGGGPGPGPGGPGGGEARQHDESADAPTLFTAVQEKLGLKMEPRKGPVDLYVIDHIEKVATEN